MSSSKLWCKFFCFCTSVIFFCNESISSCKSFRLCSYVASNVFNLFRAFPFSVCFEIDPTWLSFSCLSFNNNASIVTLLEWRSCRNRSALISSSRRRLLASRASSAARLRASVNALVVASCTFRWPSFVLYSDQPPFTAVG